MKEDNLAQVPKSRILRDLVDYTKLPPQLVAARCRYAVYELAIQWSFKKNIEDFYKNSEMYIYDLTQYQIMLESHNHIKK